MSRPALNTPCALCNARGHFCPAQLFVEDLDDADRLLEVCLECADGEPCSHDRVAKANPVQRTPFDDEPPPTEARASSKPDAKKKKNTGVRYLDEIRAKVRAFPAETSTAFIAKQLGIAYGAAQWMRSRQQKERLLNETATKAALTTVPKPLPASVAAAQAPAAVPSSEEPYCEISLRFTRPEMDRLWARLETGRAARVVGSLLPELLGVAR